MTGSTGAGAALFGFRNLPLDGVLYILPGSTAVLDIDASNPLGERITYEIVGGGDLSLFTIDPETGLLSFLSAPNAGGDYEVTVRVFNENNEEEIRKLTVQVAPEPEQAPELGSISGHIFSDANNNGLDDDGASITNALVQLWRRVDGAWAMIDEVATDANGDYSFTGLEADPDYRVRFVDTTGKGFTSANAGSNDAVDSDAAALWSHYGQTGRISLSAGQDLSDVDAGVRGGWSGSISGRFFADDNKNNIDDSDAGVAGQKVELYQQIAGAWTVVRTAFTNTDGFYSFNGLSADPDYRVRFHNDTGHGFTAANRGDDASDSDVTATWWGNGGMVGQTGAISLTAGQQLRDVDAGVNAGHVRITSGDEALMGRFLGAELITNGDFETFPHKGAIYWFKYASIPGWTPDGEGGALMLHTSDYATGNKIGNAVLEIDANAGQHDAVSQVFTVTRAGTYQVSYDYGVRNHNISNEPWWYDAANNSFLVEIDGEVVQVTGSGTDAYFTQGFQHRAFDVELTAGQHTIRFLESGTNPSLTDNGNGAILDNVSVRQVSMGYDKGVLSGVFFYDGDQDGRQNNGEHGVGGRVVHLLDGEGAVVTDAHGDAITAVTDPNGAYAFSALKPGSYQVAFESGQAGAPQILSAVSSVIAGYETVAVNGAMVGETATRTIEICENETFVQDFDTTCKILTEDVYFMMTPDEVCATVARIEGQGSWTGWNNSTTDAIAHYVFLDAPAAADLTFTIRITTDPSKLLNADPAYSAPDGFAWLTDQANEIDAPRHEEIEITVKAGETQSSAFYVGTEAALNNYNFGVEIAGVQNGDLDANCELVEHVSTTPIALDLNRDGKIGVTGATTSANKSGLYAGETLKFDMNGDGTLDRMEWFDGSGDGILIDNRDGRAASNMTGLRLFGDEGGVYRDGYDKLLKLFDANRDGVVTGAEMNGLALWVDDGDAVVETGEIQSLAAHSVTAISGVVSVETDGDGRQLIRSSVTQNLEATGAVAYALEGADAELFHVNARTGEVRFINAPDYETPRDADGDNSYEVTLVRVTDDPTCAPAREELRIEVCDKPSLGDTVWYDDNHNGLLDAGERGAAGVVVKLIDAGTGRVLAQRVTDQNGSYLFDDLNTGDYKVMFAAPDGYEFSQQTAVNAEARNGDSDADAAGMTGVITLTTGEHQRGVDAGLVSLPAQTVADAFEGCADQIIFADVLANDEGLEPLSITAIGGEAIAEGETITVDGVNFTLDSGVLKIDGAEAFAFLDIGEQATKAFSYTVSDGRGGAATETVSLTFCGDANSVDSLFATLPQSGSYQVISGLDQSTLGLGGYDLMITGTGDERLDGATLKSAYCISFYAPVLTGGDFSAAPKLDGVFISAQSSAAQNILNASAPSHFNGQTAAENMDLINWIVAQDFEGKTGAGGSAINDWEVQFAIWELTDDFDSQFLFGADLGFGDQRNTAGILQQAAAQGEGFVAGEGDIVGMIVAPASANATNSQPFIVGLDYENYDCLC